MKILAITTGQGQRKDQCLGEQLVGSRTSGQGYPQIALVIPIRLERKTSEQGK